MADERDAKIYGYIQHHAPGLLRPGVTLTPESLARIRELQQQSVSERGVVMAEPLSEQTLISAENLVKLRAMLNEYGMAITYKSNTPTGIPVHLWIADDIVSQALEPLLAEVERLRAREAAMREQLPRFLYPFEAPFTCDPCPWCHCSQDYEQHADDCLITKARVLLGLPQE